MDGQTFLPGLLGHLSGDDLKIMVIWSGYGSLSHWQCHHLTKNIWLPITLIETMHVLCLAQFYTYMYDEYLSFGVILLGVTPFEFQQDLWLQKARIAGIMCHS